MNIGIARWCAVLSWSIAMVGCGGGGPYLKSTNDFADATLKSTAALQGAVDSNHEVCRERASLDYLTKRVEGYATDTGEGAPAGRRLTFSEFFAAPTLPNVGPRGGATGAGAAPGAHSWADHCKALEVGDAVFDKGITALTGYATALQGVAGADYSGTDMGAAAGDVGALVGSIPSFPSAATAAIKALGPASATDVGPIGRLGAAIKQSYAAGEVKGVVTGADRSVKEIIAALTAYLNAVDDEEKAFEFATKGAIDALDRRLDEPPPFAAFPPAPGAAPAAAPASKPQKGKGAKEDAAPEQESKPKPVAAPRPDPLRIFSFFEAARRLNDKVDAARAKQAALRGALSRLGDAEDSLMKAGEATTKEQEKANLAAVSGFLVQVLNDVAAVHAAAVKAGASQ